MTSKAAHLSTKSLQEAIAVAQGDKAADLVIRGARYLDVFSGTFRDGDVAVFAGLIVGVADSYDGKIVIDGTGCFVVPGFIDAHVHIESSLMTPSRFEQAVLPCGTTAVIWDPHEIANVRGTAGIDWALAASEGLKLDVFVMVPSCVPSTSPAAGLETSGAVLTPPDLEPYRRHPRVLGLAEMMNFPGLLAGDEEVLTKLLHFSQMRRDGHCPGLTGKALNAYGVAGIHSCHESTSQAEADEKLGKGIHVLIREGSCAKDADALLPLLTPFTSAVLSFCSDDRNPADIAESGHINCIITKALKAGHPPESVFRAASFAPARLYGLDDRGAVAPGYQADLVLVRPHDSDWRSGFEIKTVLKNGEPIHAGHLLHRPIPLLGRVKNLQLALVSPEAFSVPAPHGYSGDKTLVRVIGAIPRQILTHSESHSLAVVHGQVMSSPKDDVLKISVLERHHGSNQRSTAFVRGFGLNNGAIATSINHDSHNVICVGSSDEFMARAVNELIKIDGGIVVVTGNGDLETLPLPIGGLMTDETPATVTAALHRLKALAQKAGCTLEEPFLQLSFLALPVIPSLKITDKGLVDVGRFCLVSVHL